MGKDKVRKMFFVHGHRTIMGTAWPIENVVEKSDRDSNKPWLVTFGLCNGVSQNTQRFRLKRDAMEVARQ
jgi:hypothetical protein